MQGKIMYYEPTVINGSNKRQLRWLNKTPKRLRTGTKKA